MKSPIRFGQHLVSKIITPVDLPNHPGFYIRTLKKKDIRGDSWLSKRRVALESLLSAGNLGITIINHNNEFIGYCFVARGKARPSHIHKMPTGSVWIHYWRVKDGYQGKGLGRFMLAGTVKAVRDMGHDGPIYIDTSKNNLPSRMSQNRLGFVENGIYYSFRLGTVRLPFLYFQTGIWLRNKKHPKIRIT